MIRINITFPENLLSEADQIAKAISMSRSKLFCEAVKRFMEHYRQEKEEKVRSSKIKKAISVQDNLRAKSGDWDALAELRRQRYSH